LAFQVQVGGGDEGVDAGSGGGLECEAGAVDVGGDAAGQGRDDGTADLGGDAPDRRGVRLGGDGKPGFDEVDIQLVELAREPQLLLDMHREPGRLLPVAQCRIEDDDSRIYHAVPPSAGSPSRQYTAVVIR